MTAPTTLATREEVLEHLEHAAHHIGTVLVTIDGRTVTAVLAFPEEKKRRIALFVDGDIPRFFAGVMVEVAYHRDDARYTFNTVITTADAQRWWVAFPHTITRHSGRGAIRYEVQPRDGLAFWLDTPTAVSVPVELRDLSAGGMSIRYAPSALALRDGDTLTGALQLPDAWIPVKVEIRYTRTFADRRSRLGGCLFVGISPWGRALLLRAVARFASRQSDGQSASR